MAEPEYPHPPANDLKAQKLEKKYYEETRKSLIARLGDWEDQKSWNEFHRKYWRLIFSVAIKAGLRQDEAFDVVQETIFAIAKQSKHNRYDPNAGSFKSWLLQMTRWRITDQFRKRKKDTAMHLRESDEEDGDNFIERFADPQSDTLDRYWEIEWKKNIAAAALERAKEKVKPKQFQIYYCYVVEQMEAKEVCEHLDVSLAQVYVAKHRVGRIVQKEISVLEQEKDR